MASYKFYYNLSSNSGMLKECLECHREGKRYQSFNEDSYNGSKGKINFTATDLMEKNMIKFYNL